MSPENNYIIFENIFLSSYCFGLIEWAESTGFNKNNSLTFEDEKLAEYIWRKLNFNLPKNQKLNRIGLNETFRLIKIENQNFPIKEQQDYIRYMNESSEYDIYIFLNQIDVINRLSNLIKKADLIAIPASNTNEYSIPVNGTLYYLKTESIIRLDI